MKAMTKGLIECSNRWTKTKHQNIRQKIILELEDMNHSNRVSYYLRNRRSNPMIIFISYSELLLI